MRVDHGSHRLHPSTDPRILEELQALLGGDLQRRTRHGRIRLQGRWISFPLKGAELVSKMPKGFAARAALDTMTSPLRRPRSDDFAGVLRAGLGPAISDGFYLPYARKIWGADPSELSAEQARRRVSANSPLKILKRAFKGSGSGGEAGSGHFYYPRRGYGQISEALGEAATQRGAKIVTGAAATSIDVTDSSVSVATEGGDRYEGERLWSTIPLTLLARLMDAPEEVLTAAGSLEFRAMLLVYLVLETDRYTEYDAHYFPEPFTPVTRISEPKNYRDSFEDPSGRTVLCAEIPCGRGGDLWTADDEELGRVVTLGLRDAGLPAAEPSEVRVERLPFAYPIYLTGYERHFAVLDAWASSHERILTFGRQGLFAHDNAHHALAMAWDAVAALSSRGDFDTASWADARERFKSHVVED